MFAKPQNETFMRCSNVQVVCVNNPLYYLLLLEIRCVFYYEHHVSRGGTVPGPGYENENLGHVNK